MSPRSRTVPPAMLIKMVVRELSGKIIAPAPLNDAWTDEQSIVMDLSITKA